jgi:hypothetical protein
MQHLGTGKPGRIIIMERCISVAIVVKFFMIMKRILFQEACIVGLVIKESKKELPLLGQLFFVTEK